MLIKLAITKKNLRNTLQNDLDIYLSRPTPEHITASDSISKISELYARNNAVNLIEIIRAILNTTELPTEDITNRLKEALTLLDEASWAKLIILLDRCAEERTGAYLQLRSTIKKALEQIAQDTLLQPETRLSAFYFLRSQSAHEDVMDNSEFSVFIRAELATIAPEQLSALLDRDTSVTANAKKKFYHSSEKRIAAQATAAMEAEATKGVKELNEFDFYFMLDKPKEFNTLLESTLNLQMQCLANVRASKNAVDVARRRVEAVYARLNSLPNVQYEANYKLAAFLLARRVGLNRLAMKPTSLVNQAWSHITAKSNQLKNGGALVIGKEATTPVLLNLVEHLVRCGDFTTTNPTEPFLWRIYIGEYLSTKALKKDSRFSFASRAPESLGISSERYAFTPEKISELNNWLKDRVFDRDDAEETQDLLKLPLELRNQLFGYKGSIIDPETLTVAAERDSSLFAAGMYAASKAAPTVVAAPPSLTSGEKS